MGNERNALLDGNGMTESEFLASYDIAKYPQPSITVDNVIFTVEDNDLRVLLIKRGGHPYLGSWALPGGFMAIDESTDEAVRREIREETALDLDGRLDGNSLPLYFEQLRTYSEPGRDPRGRIVSCAYMTLVGNEVASLIKAGDDASDAAWFSVSGEVGRDLVLVQVCDEDGTEEPAVLLGDDGDRLAFDHEVILSDAISRLRAKIDYSCIGFAFQDDEFTVTELRHVYEAVSGRHHDAGNFMRFFTKMLLGRGIVREADKRQTKGRPAKTYFFDGRAYDEIIR